MNHPRPARLVALLSLLSGLGLGAGCSDRLRVDVAVQGLSAEVYSLAVQTTFAARPFPEYPLNDRLDGFVVTLPAGSRGPLALHVEGLDTRGCAIVAGDAALTIADAAASAMVDLKPLAAPSCQLTVRLSGTGAGTVSAGGAALSCGETCQAPLPPGQPLTLTAQAAPGSFFAGWLGACSGTGPCVLNTVSRNGARVEAAFSPSEQCTSSGFCWENPLPSGDSLERVHGARRDDVWAVGAAGAVLRWNGAFVVPQRRPVSADLHSVWAVASDDVWLVGDRATVLHFDGLAMTQPAGHGLSDQALYDVWARGKDDVWLVGQGGTVLRWDGRAFSRIASDPAVDWLAVRGGAAGEVLLAGRGGAVARFDGGALTMQPNLGAFDLAALATSGTGEVVAVGGRLIAQAEVGVIRVKSDAGFVTPPGFSDLFGARLFGAFFTPGGDLWAVGGRGSLLHRRGTTWSLEDTALGESYRGVWGVDDDDLWLVGEAGLLRRWNGVQPTPLSARSGSGEDLYSIFGSGPSDLWAVGANSPILHYDGAAWRPYDSRRRTLRKVSGSGAADVWAVGDAGLILRFDGQFWTQRFNVSDGVTLYAAWSGAPNTVWVGGDNGALARFTTAGLSIDASQPGETFRALWGTAESDIWAVGEAGVIRHYDGARWTRVASSTSETLLAVWGSGPSDVWVAGTKGVLLRNRGQGFQPVSDGPAQLDPTLVNIAGLCGSNANDVWAVGQGRDTVYHFDGSRWEARGRIGLALTALSCQGSQVWAVGASGAIVHRR